MKATRIVITGLIVSLNVACKAKFTSVNSPASPSASAQAAPGPQAGFPVGPDLDDGGPQLPPPGQPPRVDNNNPGGLPPVIDEPTAPEQPRSCHTGDDGTVDPRRPVAERTVRFHQGLQMVWRKNCDGKVVSKRYENVTKLGRQSIRWIHKGKGLFSAYNRSTCASMSPSHIKNLKSGELTLMVSLDPNASALLVQPGRNIIDYQFGESRGTLILNVVIDRSGSGCVVYKAKNCPEKHKEQDWSLGGDIFGK